MDFNAASSQEAFFQFPSLMPIDNDSVSYSESEFTTASEWSSLPPSHQNSPSMSSNVAAPLNGTTLPMEPLNEADIDAYWKSLNLQASGPAPRPFDPFADRLSRSLMSSPYHRPEMFRSATDSPPKPQRIPRPPNAFMLFRSDFLKQGIIPQDVERRQQNLSRIAGECWNMLPDVEKKKWQEKAARALADHQARYPSYKFTPSPRTGSKAKSKARSYDADDEDEKDRIRKLRERYIPQMSGPAVPPTRKRKTPSRPRRKAVHDPIMFSTMHPAMPSSLPASPAGSSPSPSSTFAHPLLPPSFYQSSYSRPSSRSSHSSHSSHYSTAMSQGSPQHVPYISRSSPSRFTLPSSGVSTTPRTTPLDQPDYDATPTAANFHSMALADEMHRAYTDTGSSDMLFMPQSSYVESALGLNDLRLPYNHQMSSVGQDSAWSASASHTKTEDVSVGDALMDSLLADPFARAQAAWASPSPVEDAMSSTENLSVIDSWHPFEASSRDGSPKSETQ
ncbi:hypothetical protein EWM64_g5586 [Hericium alpestre]|uniref:HMG box domain-containing protein n=1 Tax=Hericium alpestre TaxID=135208 RepID=A0A4Y9ZW57_9AGAM|nr:hypothetical protein EWM64_g5586 [Hericium alpestre]